MTKRIQIAIDMENNEVLDAAIQEAIKAQARQIAREVFAQELESEIIRLTDAKLRQIKAMESYSQTATRIAEVVSQRIAKETLVDEQLVAKLVSEKMENYLDSKLTRFGGVESYIKKYFNQSLADMLTNK